MVSNVNVWDVTDPIRELVRSERVVDADRLADPGVPLGEVEPRPTGTPSRGVGRDASITPGAAVP
ncbi:hypothetical protein ACIRYZ_28675 [Kitasatospora sp. NPDC101155]|uniref:hypothetical protein n=1 Tax=Kitasatospora sp. NPDC101155 TaxID=3364097 RepID=UPI00382CAAF3